MRTTAELREGFLSFFESKGHKRHPSGSLVPPEWDRSTLLNSAGMQPLMPYFLGQDTPPAPLLTTAQKCFRTPDIEEVGNDGYHLTFFEMLGNFSFGEYFKQGAIEFAWEFITEHLRIDTDRMWVSVFAGDPALGLDADETALELWKQIGFPPERIVRLGREHNFWSVGGPGPCGPDTEMFYDRGEEIGCGQPTCGPGCTCERYLEFWNLVFMEFELLADGSVIPLPKQNVDTGMGLERTAAILQDVISVYETDGYQAIMEWIAGESGVAYGESEAATRAHRILADHGRGMTFLAADGVVPSNEGRGYVMRRVIRRAVQQARAIGLERLWPLTEVVIEQMGDWYPELRDNRGHIQEIVRGEEERFSQTVERGMRLFEEIVTKGDITGEDAFRLHDTYGFPLELTKELAAERGLEINEEEFTRLMAEQRERSRRAAASEVELRLTGGPSTDFVGYEKTEVLTAISAVEDLEDGTFQAKLYESPFYPEGGGQVSDIGFIEHEESGRRAELIRASRVGDDQVLTFQGDRFEVGDRVRAVVPWTVRFPTMANHTATHLLHKALSDVLGDHVRQAGSAVRPDKLRFDFTHPEALSADERHEIERLVNEKIFENRAVRAFVAPIDEARRLGAMMLFGEKYGDEVRVVEIDGYSRELCGGTHVRWTAEIGPFVILSESSVGAGARRIEAVTSGEAYSTLRARSIDAEDLRAELERTRKEARKKDAGAAGPDIVEERRNRAGDVEVIVIEAKAANADDLLQLSDRLKQQHAPAAVVLGSRDDGNAHLVLNFDRSLEGRGVDAGAMIKQVAALIGGGGGGRATMARGGGRSPDGLPEALAAAEQALLEQLG